MVYVEGTKKAMKRFIRLMTHRIQWNQRVDSTPEDENEKKQENDDSRFNSCNLLWQVRT